MLNVEKVKSEINPNEAYTPREIKEILKIPEVTIRRWARDGKIPRMKLFGRVLIKGSDLLKILDQ